VISSVPSQHANTVAPYAPLGRQPVGQESTDLKNSSFKALEQTSGSAANQNQRPPEGRADKQQVAAGSDQTKSNTEPVGQVSQSKQEQATKERQQIDELAKVDRDVRAHEQAHAAVAGEYAGITTYKFVRGPDGVSYAVGGEVSISTSAVPNNPEATIRKAQQIRQAANAPSDPSPQDRRVAAEASRMEIEARAQLAVKDAEAVQQQAAAAEQKTKAQKADAAAESERESRADSVARREAEQQQADLTRRSAERTDILVKAGKTNININRKLVEIGVEKGSSGLGIFFNSKA